VHSPNLPGHCIDDAPTSDPRVFGPALWKAFHLIAANWPNPPTEAARQACVGFVMALPYMVPCRHCGWHLGEFIKTNIEMDGEESADCAGAPGESTCQSPAEACKSQFNLTRFFVRAHNNVNQHTNPCRAPYTTADAFAQYKKASPKFCYHNIVWGSAQLCSGPYYDQGGSVSSAFSGTGCAPGVASCDPLAPASQLDVDNLYFGVNSTCQPASAQSCGSVSCDEEVHSQKQRNEALTLAHAQTIHYTSN